MKIICLLALVASAMSIKMPMEMAETETLS